MESEINLGKRNIRPKNLAVMHPEQVKARSHLLACHHSCPPLQPPPLQSRPIRIVTKIPDIEPEDLTPDFLLKISASFASHPIHPCMLVGASVRRGCVELVMDLVPMSESSHVSANWDPLSQGHLDPSLWLQHLHVNPPRGTQVLSQACGR